MKNYELIEELCKLPAGAEVVFDGMVDENRVAFQKDLDDDGYYNINTIIENVDVVGMHIALS